jgi:2'-hydroxyisoflavone reductase
MNLLILGGTQFVGRHLVDAATSAGHTVTLFHRGNRNPYPNLENILGDRTNPDDLKRLDGHWDAVIDTSGYVPRLVGMSAAQLEPRVKRYCFISSVSVYQSFTPAPDESAPIAVLEDTTVEEITGGTYGGLKALCESAVQDVFTAARSLILRPGLIVGRSDPTDRFTYWVERIARGGDVLAPGTPDDVTSFIDAADVARFTIRALEESLSGTYNLDGKKMPFGALLETMKIVSASTAKLEWIPGDWLLERDVKTWMGEDSLPLWTVGDGIGVDITKASGIGLTHRPLEETLRDTLEFVRGRGDAHAWRSGITSARETALLEAWHGQQREV